MIKIDIDMPKCCESCFALDERGDYPYCLISHDQRGYNFNIYVHRMPTCPLIEEPTCPFIEENEFNKEEPLETEWR